MEELKELTEKLEQKTRDCENWSKMHSELLELSVNQQTTIDELRHLENDLELADKKVITSSLWYFAKGLILGAIIMYLLIN
jgi:iron-sulfur cluster repair protein YtfE (RIC family)